MTDYADLGDIRALLAELDDTSGPYDLRLWIALREAEEARDRLPAYEARTDDQSWVKARADLAAAQETARAWADLAGHP